MGTRHLIAVYDRNNELRVAQYGQWDGYPSGMGLEVLKRLPNLTSEQFENLTWIDEDQVAAHWAEFGVTDGWANMDQADRFKAKYPELSRDTSAKVLDLIVDNPNLKLNNAVDFAADGLFCEWAYVVDFATGRFEVYKGFFTKTLTSGRFDYLDTGEEYRPVQLVASWPMDQLPTEEEFLVLEGEDA